MYVLHVYGFIENIKYLFRNEKSGSKKAQNAPQHGKECEGRHNQRQAEWNFILSIGLSNDFFKTAPGMCQGA